MNRPQISFSTALSITYFLLLFLISGNLFAEEQEAENVLAASHLLDGKTFVGQNGSKGKEADHPDEFVFAGGLFRSASCDDYGFGKGEYDASVKDGVIYFQAVTTSPSHGRIQWQGKVDGDQLEATFIWTKERWYWDIRKEYWFKGRLKQ